MYQNTFTTASNNTVTLNASLNAYSPAFNFPSGLTSHYRSDAQPATGPSSTPMHAVTLQEAMRLMVLEHKRTGAWGHASVHKYRSQLQQIIAFLGPQRPVSSLTQNDIVRAKQALLCKLRGTIALSEEVPADDDQTIGGETIERYYYLLQRYCNFCLANGYLATDIHSGVKLTECSKNPDKYKTFTSPDLQRIFSSRVYTCAPFEKRRWKAQSFCFWIPLICLFTGARPGEASQIFVKDVYQEEGIWLLHVTNQSAMQTLKNKFSDRHIPLHPKLIELGFLELVEERRQVDGGEAPLFPDLRFDKRHGMARTPSRWFSGHGADSYGYLGVCGFPKSQGYCLYSFRHSFVHALRLKGVQELVIKRLVGHSTEKDVTINYGEGFSLRQIAEIVARIEFAVDFTHVSWRRYQCVMRQTRTYQAAGLI